MYHLVPASVVEELLYEKSQENETKFRSLLLWSYQNYPAEIGPRNTYEFKFFEHFKGTRFGTHHEIVRSLVRDYAALGNHVYRCTGFDITFDYGEMDLIEWFNERAFHSESGDCFFRKVSVHPPMHANDDLKVSGATYKAITAYAAEDFIPWITALKDREAAEDYVEKLYTCAMRKDHVNSCSFCRHEWNRCAGENPHPLCSILSGDEEA